jgi:hypothetical protein
MDSYLVLLRVGFTLPRLLPAARCALTAPFHPYLTTEVAGRYIFCCTFRRLAPPRCYLAPCPVEPGLSSLPERGKRSPGRLGAKTTRRPRPRQAPIAGRHNLHQQAVAVFKQLLHQPGLISRQLATGQLALNFLLIFLHANARPRCRIGEALEAKFLPQGQLLR